MEQFQNLNNLNKAQFLFVTTFDAFQIDDNIEELIRIFGENIPSIRL